MSNPPIFRTPVRTTLECDVVDGQLRIYIGQNYMPILTAPSQRVILETDGIEFLISFEARS